MQVLAVDDDRDVVIPINGSGPTLGLARPDFVGFLVVAIERDIEIFAIRSDPGLGLLRKRSRPRKADIITAAERALPRIIREVTIDLWWRIGCRDIKAGPIRSSCWGGEHSQSQKHLKRNKVGFSQHFEFFCHLAMCR